MVLPELIVEWFAFWKFNLYGNSGFSGSFPGKVIIIIIIPPVRISKFSEFLVELKVLKALASSVC